MAILNLTASRTESLPPDDRKAGDIFSRLGYRFADAVADLVDNSIDANARNVHIRFVHSTEGIHSVIIADDGDGMDDNELREAMRFGSRSSKAGTQLGKYGIGLKSASLSQAETVLVLSRQGRAMCGRRWTLENVKQNWSCEIFEAPQIRAAFKQDFGDVRVSKRGTIVIWENLGHLKAIPSHVDKTLDLTIRELRTELGIRFHRFIESQRLTIGVDRQFALTESSNVPTYVAALDPFGYEESPDKRYPLSIPIRVAGTKVLVECHIWPPRTSSVNYKLGGGKVALRQGFYFYRNDRIIQAGGWNQLRADDSEPHLSLARVKIDLPAALDSQFKLDVTKSRLDPGPEFMTALQTASSPDGITFEKYLEHADSAYRKQKAKDGARFPVTPGTGLSAKARGAIQAILRESGTGQPRKVAFKWSALDVDEIVRVEPGKFEIVLNSRYRKMLSEGGTRDAPVLKVALMFLLQEELSKAFFTKVLEDRLQKINQALLASLKS